MMRTGQIFLLLALLLPFFTLIISASVKVPETADVRSGQCPPERYYQKATTGERFLQICSSDRQCPLNWKCCHDNGYTFCKPPAQERQGQCPAFDSALSTASKCNDNCTSDSECPHNYKCCLKHCGRTCVPVGDHAGPKGNFFCLQEASYNCLWKDRYLCDEASCTDGFKCCPVICRTQCEPALKERAGKCPAPETACPLGSENKTCTSDNDCMTFHKCCSTSCGQRCVQAQKPRIPYNLHEIGAAFP
ncbi:uncharacterized protein PAF06_016903 [Gastrophryne carolinensis]